jgi:TRAP-type C4-dicarboxylate transport system substrate-binding protein
MKRTIWATLVLIMLCSVAFATGSSETKASENLVLSFSNGSLSTSIDGEAMGKMQEYVSKASNGKIAVDAHWQNSLFTQDQEIPAIMKGNLDMCQAQPSQLATYFPKMYTLTATYIFKDYNHWKKFYESEEAQKIFDEMEKKLGIVVLSVENFGARTISLTIDKKITSREDMKGIKLRTMSDESSIFMGEALGANSFPIPYPDVYMSLQTGTIDGQENVIKTIIDNSYYEVLKSVTLNRHVCFLPPQKENMSA